jgi:nucleoside-diphosphate-sugar epimerase
MSELHVVLGSNGGVGSAVLEELTRRSLPARGVSRSGEGFHPAGADLFAADLTDPAAIAKALDGASVVYQCAQPAYTRMSQDFPLMNRAIMAATVKVGAKLVFADNLYMYPPGTNPMREDSPTTAPGKKGHARALMSEELLRAHADGTLRVALGRPSDYYGPRGIESGLGERVFAWALRGKKLSWLGSLDVPHTVSYLPDIGRGMVVLGTDARADGQVWHLPSGPALTGREFLTLVCESAGKPPRMTAVPPVMLSVAGLFNPLLRELKETTYQWTSPFIVDTQKFQDTFGPFLESPVADAVATTLDWFRQHES